MTVIYIYLLPRSKEKKYVEKAKKMYECALAVDGGGVVDSLDALSKTGTPNAGGHYQAHWALGNLYYKHFED